MIILYTIAGLYRPAGMERILTDKANYLAAAGNRVVIVTTEQKGRPVVFPLDESIRLIDLSIGYEDNNGESFLSKLLLYPSKRRKHKKQLELVIQDVSPDIVVSMFCGDEAFLPSFHDGSKKILEVHFSRYKRIQYGRKGVWALADRYRSMLDKRRVRRFDRFVMLTEEDFHDWGSPANGLVIPNFINRLPDSPSDLHEKIVLSVGRYCYQKGYDRLLKAWAIVCAQLPFRHGWRLRLVGGGEDRRSLLRMADDLCLTNLVEISLPRSDMEMVYRRASIFALSSRYEGLPMVLLEAQSYGLPIVSFDTKCGPRDIISDGEDGLLVAEGDIPALADAILKLVKDEELRRAMGSRAREKAQMWDKEKIMVKWIQLFESIL